MKNGHEWQMAAQSKYHSKQVLLYGLIYFFLINGLQQQVTNMLQTDPVKFTPLVFTTKATSQIATITSTLIVLHYLLPMYSVTCMGSEDNSD